jgi:hypothetical protein
VNASGIVAKSGTSSASRSEHDGAPVVENAGGGSPTRRGSRPLRGHLDRLRLPADYATSGQALAFVVNQAGDVVQSEQPSAARPAELRRA